MKHLVLRCWWLVLVFVTACFSPQFQDGQIKCGPNDECPPGLTCSVGICRASNGNGPKDAADTMGPPAPTLTSVTPASPANNNSPVVVGSAEAGSTITIYSDGNCTTQVATGNAANLASPGITVNVTDDSTNMFSAKATDMAGNSSPCSNALPYVEDSVAPAAPAITSSVPASPSRSIVPSIHGTAEASASITLYGNENCLGTAIGTGTANASGVFAVTATVPAAQVSKLAATAKDAAGNTSPCSTQFIYEQDASAVGVPALSQITTPASPSKTSTTPMITGSAEANITVRLYADAACQGAVVGTGTADGSGAFSIMVTVGANSTTTFYGQAFDSTVNQTSACSQQGVTYTHDSIAPPTPTLMSSTPTPPSNATMPNINGTGEPGATVELYTSSTCSGSPVASGTTNAMGQYSIAVVVAATTQFYAKAKDPAGNASTCSAASFTYTFDATAPGAPMMLATIPASPSTSNNTPLVTGNAEAGSTVRIFRTADCTGAEAGSGIASTPSGSFGIGITLASNSSTPLTANATDAAGNTSACSSMLTYLHDSLEPAPPTITASTPASPSNMNSPMISGMSEVGATVRLYTNNTCTTQIGSAATANGAGAFSITISVADNSSTSLYAKATDVAGNVSQCSSAFTFNEDSTAPNAPALNSIPPSSTSTMPTLTGSAEAGTTVAVYASSNCSGTMLAMGPATGGTFSIGVTVTANTSTPFTAKATDAAGNVSACSSSITYIHDNMTPGSPTIAGTTPPSPAGSNNPTINGTAEANSTVRLFTNPTCSTAVAGTATANGSGMFSVSLTVVNGSTTTFYATASDAAGNSSGCSTSFATYTQDSAAPPAPTGLASTPASPSSTMTPSITGSTEASAVVKLYTNSTCTSAVAFMGTANGAGNFSIATTVTANATTTFWATATDAAGNASACSSSSVAYLHDSIVPGTPTITSSTPGSPANNNSPTITGTAETGATVKLFTSSNCSTGQLATGTAAAGAFSIPISVADNSVTNVYASATDAAGNVSMCSTVLTYTEDSAAPGTPTGLNTNPTSPVHNTSPSVTGTGETGATIRIYTTVTCTGAVAGQATAVGNMFTVPVSVGANSTTTFYAKATDAAGNQSGCSSGVTYVEDSDPPSMPTITATTPASPANNNTPQVSGTADTGSTVKIFTNAACTTQVASVVASAGAFAVTTSTLPGDTTTNLYANATDTAGNVSPCTSSGFAYIEDSTAPNAPTGLTTTPPSPANANNPSINGNAEANSTVRAYTSNMCTAPSLAGTTTAAGNGAFSIPVSVADNTVTTFYVTARDAAGNTSACAAASITYTEDSSAVEPPTLVSTTPASPSNASTSPTLNGTSGNNYTIRIYTNPTCTTQIAMGTASGTGNFSIAVTATANATTTFYATAFNGVNTSACSLGLAYIHDNTPPARPTVVSSTPASPANYNNPSIEGTAEDGTTVNLYLNSGCTGGSVGTGFSTGGVFSANVTPVANDSTTTYYANATDAAGNVSPCSTSSLTYIEDSTPPPAPSMTSTTPTSPTNATTTPNVNGTAQTGATVRLFTTSDCTGPIAAQGTATAGAFSIQVTVAANSATTFKATATDPAGNLSPCSANAVTYTHDNQAPSVPTGLAVSPVGPANNNSPSVTGTADTGSTVRIYTNSMCTGGSVGTGTASGGTFSIAVSVADNSTTTFYANSSDTAGNTSACSATPGVTYTEDSTAPTTPVISGSTPSSPSKTSTTPTINGTAETGTTVALYTNAGCTGGSVASATATAGAFSIGVTVTANTATTFYAKSTDSASNASGCSTGFTYTHDNIAPTTPVPTGTNPASPNGNNNPQVTGTAEANATITLYTAAACTTVAATGTATAGGTFSVTLPVADNTTTQIYVRATDAAGNPSGCTTTAITYVEDSAAPGMPTLSTITSNPANNNSPVITGATNESGATIKLYSNSSCTSGVLGTATSTAGPPVGAFSVTGSVANDTTTTFYATATDAAGNASACSAASLTYIEDSTPPAVPTSLGTSPASPSSSNTLSVTGTTTAGVTVRVYQTSNCTGTFASGTSLGSGAFSISQTVAADSTTTFSALAVDAAGNASACSQSIQYVEDSTCNPPTLTSTTPSSPSNYELAPTINGVGEAKATIYIFDDAACNNRVSSGDIDSSGNFAISVTVDKNTLTKFYGQVVDGAGNVSSCSSSSITYINDMKDPGQPGSVTAVATATDKIQVSWASAVDNFTASGNMLYQVCWRATPTGGCIGNQQTGAGATSYTITGLTPSQRYWIEVQALDLAGNVSGYTTAVTDKTFGPGATIAVSAGFNHTCALLADGTVRCWGDNNYGQLGDGTNVDRPAPVDPGLTDIVAISTGGAAIANVASTCALSASGTVYCWGSNQYGQLGNGSLGGQSSSPAAVVGISNAVSISAGGHNGCAVLSTGEIKCWGLGAQGELGNGTSANSGTPVLVSGISTAVQVDVGYRFVCALLADGSARCWGDGGGGRLGDNNISGHSSSTPVNVMGLGSAKQIDVGGYHACALRYNGQVRCWGSNVSGQLGNGTLTDSGIAVDVLSGGSVLGNVRSISAGGDYPRPPNADNYGSSCAVLADGTMKCWGYNNFGQLGDGTTSTQNQAVTVLGASNVAQSTSGAEHNCFMAGDGQLKCWGSGGDYRLGTGTTSNASTPVAVQNLAGQERMPQIAAGGAHSCGRTSNGRVYCWGYAGNGQTGDDNLTSHGYATTPVVFAGNPLTDALKVDTGLAHACALRANGSVVCWGYNYYGQVGDGNYGSAADRPHAVAVTGVTNAIDIATGFYNSCALLATGGVMCWGYNSFGQVGNGTTTTQEPVPVVSSISTATKIDAGGYHVCARGAAGGALCWGYNFYGALGDNTTMQRPSPVSVMSISNVVSISTGRYTTCAVVGGGAARCWGYGADGQMGNNTLNTTNMLPITPNGVNYTSISVGDYHVCSTRVDGSTYCWGRNTAGQLGIGSTANPQAVPLLVNLGLLGQVNGGGTHTCAVEDDGMASCWGESADSRLGNNVFSSGSVTLPTAVINFPP